MPLEESTHSRLEWRWKQRQMLVVLREQGKHYCGAFIK